MRLFLLPLLATAAAAQTIHDDTGYNDLLARLGGAVPTGAGVVVGHVEALSGGGYGPDTSHPELAGKSYQYKSGATTISAHATTVGRHFYGLLTGIAPGIDDVRLWEASHWLSTGFLNGAGLIPPKSAGPVQVMNCSWIATTAPNADAVYLRKLDAAIASQDLVVVVGVANGSGPLNATLLAQGYGVIAVGRSDGSHAAGGTTVGVAGRMKPELVAPGTATSFATPLVGGAAALLLETAATDPGLAGNPRATRPELIKAILMAGAEKRPGWSNGAPSSGPLRGLTSTPLDPVFGADELDVNQSHWILTSLEQAGATSPSVSPSKQRGWNVIPIADGTSVWWRFTVSVQKPTVDAALSWNRLVATDYLSAVTTDIDLRLWKIDAQGNPVSLIGDATSYSSGNVASESPVDNVELLHLCDLVPGQYALEVARPGDGFPAPWQVAVAWNMTCPAPDVYCSAKPASAGCLPSISASGEASASDPNLFDLTAANVVNNKNGLLFYGFAPAALPFGGGTLCVQPPLRRTPVQSSSGNPPPDDCSGTFSFDMRSHIQSGADPLLVPGADVYAQWWFRDPAAVAAVGLTDAAHFSICQ